MSPVTFLAVPFAIALESLVCGIAQAPTPRPPVFLQWAPTPPMGWNSWDSFATTIREDEAKAEADYMADHLASHGWQYVVGQMAWVANVPGSPDKYLAVFNLADKGSSLVRGIAVPVKLGDLGFTGACQIRDLWKHQNLATTRDTFAPVLAWHGAGVYRVHEGISSALGRYTQ